MADITISLGDRIRIARRHADLSQHELALTIGVDTDTLGRWEAGRSEPRASQIAALSRALGVDVAALMGPS